MAGLILRYDYRLKKHFLKEKEMEARQCLLGMLKDGVLDASLRVVPYLF